jgi:hypothetical protein
MRHIGDSIIYLTGFFSTVLFVLCGINYPSNKTLFIWTLFGGLVLGLLTGFLIWQNEVWKNQESIKAITQKDIKPSISCIMEYPIKTEDDKVFRDKHNPEIVISNNGPVKALSVSGNVTAYQYDPQKDEITAVTFQGMKSFAHSFSKEELKPFNEIRHSTIGFSGHDVMAVYVISVVYHIEPDMERFVLESRFFVENKEIKDEGQFKQDKRYNHLMEKLGAFKITNESGLVVNLTAAAEHVWLLEPENWLSAKKDSDGKVTILGLPKDQGATKNDGYPFLEMKPHPFKATGFYTKSEIVEDHVEVKTAFAVTNSGDAAAMITEDGFEIVKTIEPGQTKYYTKTINVGRMEGNKQPLENFIKLIDESEKAFEIKFNINYRPANDYEKLFKVTGHYFVGKYKVTQISHSTHVNTP